MLGRLTTEDARRLRNFFFESGYTETELSRTLKGSEVRSRQLRNDARLLYRTSEPTRLNCLLRWFWLGFPGIEGASRDLVPAEILSLLIDTGLLEPERSSPDRSGGEAFVPRVMLLPVGDHLVAADCPSALSKENRDLVLWPNPTTRFLSRFTVRRHSRATLDLGTGTGVLSLQASPHSDVVVATDLNPRAVEFARFNAELNEVANLEALAGDGFEPVRGRRFDLIVSNPPFFITPQSDYLFCENPMDLDGLCRRLIKEAPGYLNEDGYLEMLCEWAEIRDQPWQERVGEWVEGSGCDAWVMKGITEDPAEYAQHRIREISQDDSGDRANYEAYMNYYRQRGVEAIHGGLIVMRRREGSNFVRIEEVPTTPSGDLAAVVLSTFAAHDLLREHGSDEALAAVRPALAPHVRLEQSAVPDQGRWRTQSLVLRMTSGFPGQINVEPLVAEFLGGCDGSRPAGELIDAFAARTGVEIDRVRAECNAILRRLIERGFVVPG